MIIIKELSYILKASVNVLTRNSKLQNIVKFSSSAKTNCSNQSSHKKDESNLKKQNDADHRNDEPILFFGSQAASWKAKQTRSGGAEDVLWYQPFVISGSLAIFLLYFCVFREESDIDQKLDGNLYDKVHGLEEIQLKVNYKYNKLHGLDVTEIETRLNELGIDVKSIESDQ